MSLSNNINNNNSDLVCIFAANLGRMVTIFTKSGGCTGCGFTGLLVRVDCDFVKLTTRLPCPPRCPFGPFNNCCERDRDCDCDRDRDRRFDRDRRCRDDFGTSCVIPINAIVSFCFNET